MGQPAAQSASAAPTDALAGLVERVTYHNAENGFCVLRVKARGHKDLITVVGHAASIAAGEWVHLSGTWFNDRTHGLQFRAGFLKASPPTTLEGIERYLGSGMICGIGPVYARKLVRAFGEQVFDLIEAEPTRLREVTGIGRLRGRDGRVAPVGIKDSLYQAAQPSSRTAQPAFQILVMLRIFPPSNSMA